MKKILSVIALLIPLLTFAAEPLPTWYPQGLSYGEIYSVDNSYLLVNDMRMRVSPVVKVSTLTKERASISDLKEKMGIGFKLTKVNKILMVDHIYVMPEGMAIDLGF